MVVFYGTPTLTEWPVAHRVAQRRAPLNVEELTAPLACTTRALAFWAFTPSWCLLLFLLLLLLLLLLLSPFPFPSRPLLLVCLLLFLLLSFSLPLVLALLLRLLLFSSSSSSFSFSFSFSPCASPVLRDEKNEDAFEVTDVLIRGRGKEGGYDG